MLFYVCFYLSRRVGFFWSWSRKKRGGGRGNNIKGKAICSAIGSADRQVSALTTSLSVQKFVYLHCQINGINGFPHGSAETCLSALLKIGGGRMKGSRRGGGRGKDIEQIDLQG